MYQKADYCYSPATLLSRPKPRRFFLFPKMIVLKERRFDTIDNKNKFVKSISICLKKSSPEPVSEVETPRKNCKNTETKTKNNWVTKIQKTFLIFLVTKFNFAAKVQFYPWHKI